MEAYGILASRSHDYMDGDVLSWKFDREEIYELEEARNDIESKLNKRLVQYGRGKYASRHEILGILTEEFHELTEAVKSGELEDIKQELIDIAVGCWFGIACINEKKLEW